VRVYFLLIAASCESLRTWPIKEPLGAQEVVGPRTPRGGVHQFHLRHRAYRKAGRPTRSKGKFATKALEQARQGSGTDTPHESIHPAGEPDAFRAM